MGILPTLAFGASLLSLIAMFAGSESLAWPMFVLSAGLGIAGLFRPGDEAPANGRVFAASAILFALLPVLRPAIQQARLDRRAAARAAEIAPLEARFRQDAAALGDDLATFHARWGRIPTGNSREDLPFITAAGLLLEIPGAEAITYPTDPFGTASERLTVRSLGDRGALIFSVGQNGVLESPPGKLMLPIDAEPADPLAPFAWTGADWRTLFYDPTNGALSNGDLAVFRPFDGGGTGGEEALAPPLQPLGRLLDALDEVESMTPLKRAEDGTMVADPASDGRAAQLFLDSGEYLAALAAAARGATNRHWNPEFWRADTPIARIDFVRGRAAYELGHYRRAADFLLDFLAVEPNNPDGHYWLGVCLYRGGRVEEALKHLAAAYQTAPGSRHESSAMDAWEAIRAGRQPSLPPSWIEQQAPGGSFPP